MGISNKLPGGADAAGPRTTCQAVYLVHLHTNFEESSGETEELGAAMSSTQYVKEPADGQKPGWQLCLQALRQISDSLVMSKCQFYYRPAAWAGKAGLSKAKDFSLDKRHCRKQR